MFHRDNSVLWLKTRTIISDAKTPLDTFALIYPYTPIFFMYSIQKIHLNLHTKVSHFFKLHNLIADRRIIIAKHRLSNCVNWTVCSLTPTYIACFCICILCFSELGRPPVESIRACFSADWAIGAVVQMFQLFCNLCSLTSSSPSRLPVRVRGHCNLSQRWLQSLRMRKRCFTMLTRQPGELGGHTMFHLFEFYVVMTKHIFFSFLEGLILWETCVYWLQKAMAQ